MLSMFEALSMRVEAARDSPVSALLFRRTPSSSMAVPKEALPPSDVALRSDRRLSVISEGLTVVPPGSREPMSLTLTICWFSKAVRSMV